MKHTYKLRIDYKDIFGNDIRQIKEYKTALAARFFFWRYSLVRNGISVAYIKDDKTIRRFIK